uniref:Anoctamin n=1 Tax=Sinocyclocheilus anshuiensis TaxID=1608454 RepID=A0A671RNY4_9TELE
YVLLSAPWNVLCYYAEEIINYILNILLSSSIGCFQVVTTPISIWSEKIQEKLHIPNIMAQDVPNLPPNYIYIILFNAAFRFLGHENKDTFFKSTQRHQILYEILARTPYGSLKTGEVGIGRLVSEHVLTATFPLHEEYQPLDHIREYFGEKIALYFAWLGFYTGWLLPAAVVGLIIFLFGIWLMVTDVAAEELCTSGDTFVMCPLCNICSYWNLSSICLLFDNGGTVFFSIFMSLWAVTFLEYWKRTKFTALAPMTVRNPVTGAEDNPQNFKIIIIMIQFYSLCLQIAIVLIFLIAIILYRTILSIIIYRSQNAFFVFSAGRIASLTGSMLNLLVILLLSRLYTYNNLQQQRIVHFLLLEMHHTKTKYEDAFILKVFIFQFVNFYSSPVYIAFFKGRFVGYPGNYNTLLGIRNEDCGASGCLIELAQELLVIMVGKQVISNIQEFVLPKLKTWWHRRKLKPAPSQEVINEPDSKPELSPWEANYQLLVCEGLFDEYLEMVLQFGFITIFVAACPLAPLFALINNWVEVRLDAQKFVCEYRRPVVERAQDIGIWLTILKFISYLAVISNAFLIAFTSDFLPRLFYCYTTGSMKGYVNFTLSAALANFAQRHMTCRYRGLIDDKGQPTQDYYNLLAIRLSFVIIFEVHGLH